MSAGEHILSKYHSIHFHFPPAGYNVDLVTEDKSSGSSPSNGHAEKVSARPVWDDEDEDEESTRGPDLASSEPEWVLKRRRLLASTGDRSVDDDAVTDTSTLTGRLTKVKPGRRTSGVRFLIERQTDSRHKITVS
ncbi:uncharacterized protein BXIN_2616 [Babesia sp. Xinjiang]|uniref:uncharacterized protein n=1 Tax=Babesia sp. Xinjiang TaxID=462227 RepID=UPI000A243B0F|nr:uncharacterized protein BXIN_2704 [Babesia sp. Xinjiang]XP_028872091.1 uncharacterized protein BXIN_2616 [Babesia sp. Xinjiang]ORM41569.1 hypothetical protein BXIN_2704 [Babesia sp. Xinjiang]ORM41635.1 hypothetical protein BXIN_2616 [Babesia sp. Xinjiang]